MNEPDRRWSRPLKYIVAIVLLLLGALVLYQFRSIIPPLVLAFLVAFILDPIVDLLTERLRLSRGLATTLVFAILILITLALVATPVTILPHPKEIASSIENVLSDLIRRSGEFFERPLIVGDYSLDLGVIYQQVGTALNSYIDKVIPGTVNIAGGIAAFAFWLLFILMASFYLLKDIDRLTRVIDKLSPPGYDDDFRRLRKQITDVWHAFLRGQLLLAALLTAITTVALSAVGLRVAWVMGIITGLMAFVPNIGPIISAVPPILVAFFYGSTYMGLSNLWFAVLVAVLYIIIQLVYNNVLAPAILGRSLRLHPLVILIAVILGGSLAGILGMLLAAPALATLRIVGYYVICRLYDRDPFAALEAEEVPKQRLFLRRARKAALEQLQKRQKESNSSHE